MMTLQLRPGGSRHCLYYRGKDGKAVFDSMRDAKPTRAERAIIKAVIKKEALRAQGTHRAWNVAIHPPRHCLRQQIPICERHGMTLGHFVRDFFGLSYH